MIYEAFYRSTTRRAADDALPQIVSYVWLGQALLAMLPWNADAEVRAMVRSGAVAYELCRPLDLYGLWYARALAWRTAPTVLRAVPMCLIAAVILPLVGLDEWRLAPPPSLGVGCRVRRQRSSCTLLLGCALTTLINISLLWTISGEGAVMLMTALVTFLSGMIIPLPLFPDWAQPIVQALPFAGLVDLPFRVYTGHIPPGAVAVRAAAPAALDRRARARSAAGCSPAGMRRVVVQGG